MAHDDHKCSTNTYYLEQISAIAGCGALGLFLFLTWFDGSLMFFLVPKYHPLVLISCYLLLGIVTIRSLAVWFSSVRQKSGSTHSHTHGHAHECPSHDQCHTHDHEHVWSPWHYVVLLLPVVLHFLFPAAGFSGEGNAVDPSSVGVIKPVEPKGDDEGTEIGFMTLERAAMSVETRSHYEGRTYSLRGMFLGNDERFFTLTRYKMSCCPADAQALNAVIMLDEKSKERLPYNQLRKRWVEVTGRVQFITLKGTNGFMPALVLYPSPEKPLSQLVKEIPPDPNPYAN